MKKLILLLVVLSACNPNKETASENHPCKVYHLDADKSIYTTEIEGCEYLVFSGPYKGNITHKQNCKNHESAN